MAGGMIQEEAQAIIAQLGLAPHPEGGWYKETWRAAAHPGERSGGTAILFLLEKGQMSHWHRVDADEIWFWHAGNALALIRSEKETGPVEKIWLGPNVLAGDTPQATIPAHWWQAAEASLGWALVSCTVTPGFDFSGFELAPPGWEPG